MRRHTQIVTLSIDVDLRVLPPPEDWDWISIGADMKGAAGITVLASGPIKPSEQRERHDVQTLAERFEQVMSAIPRDGLDEAARIGLEEAIGEITDIAFNGAFDEAVQDIAELPA